MQVTIYNRDRLLKMKPGEDVVWIAAEMPVFRMHDGYFGHYLDGNPDDPWAVNCIKGTSPKVFMPQKLTYVGRFDMPDSSSDYLFVFSARNNDLRFYGRVMSWYHNGFTSFADTKRLTGGTFCNLLSEHSLVSFDKAFFDREECAVKCRDLNQKFCCSDALGNLGKWYEKTLYDMQKQLTECLNADYVVNPVEKLKNAVEGKGD